MANMQLLRAALLAGIGVLLAQPSARALNVDVDEASIRRASEIALGSETARARFHEAYRVPIDDPLFERVEVVTEFRRYVLEAERQRAQGNWMMTRGGYDSKGRTLKELLSEVHGQVVVRVHLRLHPLHTYATLPPFEILLGDPGLLPIKSSSAPDIAGIRKDGKDASALTGGVLETAFNAPSIGNAALPLRVIVDGRLIGRATIDFSKIE
jgi:hypothetical protein